MKQVSINLQKKIEQTYKKIYTIFFKYGIFLLLIILSFIKVYSIVSSQKNNTITIQTLSQQKQNKITEFRTQLNLAQQQQIFSGIFVFGQFSESDEHIESFNNLAYYKGFIIPRFFWLSKTAPIQDIEYFQKSTYSLEELKTLYNNIFIGSSKNTKQPTTNTGFPLPQGIIKEFNLDCLYQKKISNIICDVFIDKFLDEFFIYNIDTDIDDFEKTINKLIIQKKYNNKCCQTLLNYDYYFQKENSTINNVFSLCDPTYQNKHRMFLDFSEVQSELFGKLISNKIYKDNTINIYKLISFQQIIYDDIEHKIINTDRLNGYFGFLQELIKRGKLDKFYKELSYFFNNYYIKQAISNTDITNKIPDKATLADLSKQISNINNGNTLIGYIGLKENINQNIISVEIDIDNNTDNRDPQQDIENLLEQIQNIEIQQKFISGNILLVYGTLSIEKDVKANQDEEKTIFIPTKLQLEAHNNTLFIKHTLFEGFEGISDTINQILNTNKRVYADLQKYISQNKFLFVTINTEQTIETEKICENLKISLPNHEITSCDNTKVHIDIFRKNRAINIKISHKDFILNKIDISDQDAKTLFNQFLEETQLTNRINREKTTKETFVGFIAETISDFLKFTPKTSNTTEGSTNTLIVIEKVKQYLGVTLKDILEKDGKILIEFKISSISFLGYYDIISHKIGPIYFKEANQNKTPLLIKNISLTLSESGKPLINDFKNNPLETIKHYSPDEYLLYQKFISEK